MLTRLHLFIFLIIIIIFANQTPSCFGTGEDVPLLEFKEGLRDSSALDETWRKGSDPCRDQWTGVECNEGGVSVSALKLIHLGLSGISHDLDIESLQTLDKLRFVSLENNNFSGPIPEFNRLTSLRALYISGNRFSGEIPDDFFNNMRSLKRLELARNNFSGKIPGSLAKLPNLQELSLDNNQFSGPIPPIAQESLQQIDLSNNKLEGEIPQIMSKFRAQSMEGNPDLCGSMLSKSCKPQNTKENPPPAADQKGGKESSLSSASTITWVILGIVVVVLLVTILFTRVKKREEKYVGASGKENLDEVVKINNIPSSNKRTFSSSSKKGGSYKDSSSHSLRKGSASGKMLGDLVMVNEEKGIFGLQDLMKAAAEIMGSGGLGSAYKAIMQSGVSVVVKRLRDMNKLNRDSFDAEMRKLGRIRHRNILPPLAYHYHKDETMLVSEFVPKGSLMLLLHGDRGLSHAELNWPTRLKIIKGVARGMGFLHTEFADYELPHGNLKSSNILLSTNYEPLLTDYALYSMMSNNNSIQSLFSYKCPEAILYQQLSQKSDVYCLGIVILEIMTGMYPSQYLNNQKGGSDVVQLVREAISEDRIAGLIDPEIANTPNSREKMEKMLQIGDACTESDRDKRIEMREAIRSIEEIQV